MGKFQGQAEEVAKQDIMEIISHLGKPCNTHWQLSSTFIRLILMSLYKQKHKTSVPES